MKMSLRSVFKSVAVTLLCASPLYLGSVAHAAADTCTWTHGGADTKFSNALNWTGCDNGNVPENGDSLVFPATVDFDTTFGDDRVLDNDLVSASFAGIHVTGVYGTGDMDLYKITGNNFSLTGDIDGNSTTSAYPYIQIEVDMAALSPLTISSVSSTGSLAIGANAVTNQESGFAGGLSGSGALTITSDSFMGAGACQFGVARPSTPFGGDSSSFTGAITLMSSAVLSVTSRSTDLARNASSITVSQFATLSLYLDNGTDMTFSTPLVFNSGTISAFQLPETADCVNKPALKTLTIDGPITATAAVDVTPDGVNVVLSGTVTGSGYISIPDGRSASESLTIGAGVPQYSSTLTTTYDGDRSGDNPYAGENQVVIVSENAITNQVSVYGGILKGKGIVGNLFMGSGIVAPGMSPGCLTSGNVAYTGGTVQIELDGTTVCTEYDQQIVNGTVDLGSATTLDIQRLSTFAPALNTVFMILSNDGTDAITGTFASQPQGSTIVLGAYTYTISYTGGDGNDVTLTVTGAPAPSTTAPNTGFRTLSTNIVLPLLTIMTGLTLFGTRRLLKKD